MAYVFLRQLIAYLTAEDHSGQVADLCAEDLRGFIDYLRGKGPAQSSVATKIRSVKAWSKWLFAEDFMPCAAFVRVKQTKPEDKGSVRIRNANGRWHPSAPACSRLRRL